MADIRYDGEAMLHQMPTSLISSHSKFVSVLDKDRRPLVFCASHDLKFNVLQANSTGSFVLIDLSAKLNISGDVQAIAVAQHQDTLLLHIAVATGSTSTPSQIHILKPITPDFIGVTDADLRKALLPQSTSPQNVRITDFHIVRTFSRLVAVEILISYRRTLLSNRANGLSLSLYGVRPPAALRMTQRYF